MTFTYDNTNRMSQAVNGAVTTNYQYDGKGQRVVKNAAGAITLFIFDKDGRLIAEADGGGVVQRDYVYFGGRLVALATVGGSPAVFYYHVDHLGSPQVLTNQLGTVVWAGDYGVFGEVNLTTSVVESNLRFLGQYYDSETNLHYNYFRDYDPTLGRYITSDPIGLDGLMYVLGNNFTGQDTNLYAYVRNNPINYSDPTGESLSSALIAAGLTGLIVYVTVDCIDRCGKNQKNQCPPPPPMQIASDCANQCIPFLNFLGLNSINSIMLNISKRLGAAAGGN